MSKFLTLNLIGLSALICNFAPANAGCLQQSETSGYKYEGAYCTHAGYASKYKCYSGRLYCQSVDRARNRSSDHKKCKSSQWGIGNKKALACNPAVYGYDLKNNRPFCVVQTPSSSAAKCERLKNNAIKSYADNNEEYVVKLAKFYGNPKNVSQYQELSSQINNIKRLRKKSAKYCKNSTKQNKECKHLEHQYKRMQGFYETIASGIFHPSYKPKKNPLLSTNRASRINRVNSSHAPGSSFAEDVKLFGRDFHCKFISIAEKGKLKKDINGNDPVTFLNAALKRFSSEAEKVTSTYAEDEEISGVINALKAQEDKQQIDRMKFFAKVFNTKKIARHYVSKATLDSSIDRATRERIFMDRNDSFQDDISDLSDINRNKLTHLVTKDSGELYINGLAAATIVKRKFRKNFKCDSCNPSAKEQNQAEKQRNTINHYLGKKGISLKIKAAKLMKRSKCKKRRCSEIYRITVQPEPIPVCFSKLQVRRTEQIFYIENDQKKGWVIDDYQNKKGSVNGVRMSAIEHKELFQLFKRQKAYKNQNIDNNIILKEYIDSRLVDIGVANRVDFRNTNFNKPGFTKYTPSESYFKSRNFSSQSTLEVK